MKSIATGVLPVAFSVFRVTFDSFERSLLPKGIAKKQKEVFKMQENSKKYVYKLTLSAVFVALATALSLIKVYELPLGGSVTLLSMLPIVMISCMLGLKWGFGSAFVYSLIQLGFGITIDGMLGWGLTPLSLVGTIVLDYIIPFTLLGLGGIFAKKGTIGIAFGTALALVARFLCHLLSGVIIFDIWCEWDNVWFYSLCYNGSFMLPELIITTIGAVLIFSTPQVKKLIRK